MAMATSGYDRDTYRDARLLGRGNAGIADVTGGVAAFYNPAGLADTTAISFNPLDFSLGVNKNIATSFSTISSLTSGNDTLSQKFSPYLGKPMALQGTFFPHISVPGFMLGYYDYADVNIEYQDPVYPRIDLQARNDWGLIFGAARSLSPNLQVGAAIRYMKRKSLLDTLSMATVFNLTSSYLSQLVRNGEAWGYTIGTRAQFRVGPAGWIAGGVVIEDYGNTVFKNDDRSPLPDRQLQKFNVGLAYGSLIPYGSYKLLFDLKELGDSTISFTKKVYTGAEVTIPFVTLRTGLFQGYWTAGFSTTILPFIDLDLSTYGEELSSSAGLRESRYFVLSLRAGLDMRKPAKKKQRYSLEGL